MSNKAVLVDFGLAVQMTEDIYIPRDLRGTEVRQCVLSVCVYVVRTDTNTFSSSSMCVCVCVPERAAFMGY